MINGARPKSIRKWVIHKVAENEWHTMRSGFVQDVSTSGEQAINKFCEYPINKKKKPYA